MIYLRYNSLFILSVIVILLIASPDSYCSDTGVVYVNDIIDTTDFPNPEYLELFRLKQPQFTFSIENEEKYNGYTITKISFPSEFKSDSAKNNIVYLSYYRPDGSAAMPCAIIVGNLGGRFIMSGIAARLLIERNIASAVVQLPYFGKRSDVKYEDLLAACHGPELIINACIQSVLDLKRTFFWLKSRPELDPNRIGIFGISYGAIIGALAIGVETQFAPNVLVTGGGDVAKIFWTSARTVRIRNNFERLGYDLEKLRAELRIIDPLTYASRIDSDNLIMFNGRKDRVIPTSCANELWEKSGKPRIVWLNSGHITTMLHANKILSAASDAFAGVNFEQESTEPPGTVRAIWVECEGANETLSSSENIIHMLDTVSTAGFNTVFVQVYRGNRAWFLSDKADTTPYLEFKSRNNIDLLRFILDEGHARRLKIHAWLNIFRIARNRKANMLKELGENIVIVDNKGRSMLRYKGYRLPSPEGKYFVTSDESLMLDPGSDKVRQYQLNIIRELLSGYPDLDGVHLDFVRYPYTVPYPPGSRFSKAIDYGYNEDSLARFKAQTGLDPRSMSKNFINTQQWDDFRRGNVTAFIESVGNLINQQYPAIELSAAVLSWADRAYLAAFQDWRNWLENGLVDFVVPMNYTRDSTFAHYISRGSINYSADPPVYIGLQAYMAPISIEAVLDQVRDCINLGAKGIVLFSYDSILLHKPELFKALKQGPFRVCD